MMMKDELIRMLKKVCCAKCGSDDKLCTCTPDKCYQKSLENNELFSIIDTLALADNDIWIPTSKHLPYVDTAPQYDYERVTVLAVYNGDVIPMEYERAKSHGKVVRRWRFAFGRLVDRPDLVTHWMPMPKPPKK